jgi:hypothetical protein
MNFISLNLQFSEEYLRNIQYGDFWIRGTLTVFCGSEYRVHMGGGRSITEIIMGEVRLVSPAWWHTAKDGKQVGSEGKNYGRPNTEFIRG